MPMIENHMLNDNYFSTSPGNPNDDLPRCSDEDYNRRMRRAEWSLRIEKTKEAEEARAWFKEGADTVRNLTLDDIVDGIREFYDFGASTIVDRACKYLANDAIGNDRSECRRIESHWNDLTC